jgi:hypothetical protein
MPSDSFSSDRARLTAYLTGRHETRECNTR